MSPRGGTRQSQADAGINFKHYVEIAQTAERGKFDMIFLADNIGVREAHIEALSRSAQYIANFEPITLISALAAVTERIGLTCTASTSYNEPFHVARKFASLDHISGGRAGWNLVTSGQAVEARNFGRDFHFGHAERYERANEFAEIVVALWDSWDDDAFPRDKDSGRFFDPAKMHFLNHDGKHFKVQGPLNIPRPPQGRPVIVQAGTSDDGMDVAARFAEVIFSANLTMDTCQKYFKEVKTRAQDKFGRNPDHLKVMPGLSRLRRPHRGRSQREIRLSELADASDRGARNPVDRARRRRPDALRFRRAAAGQSADVERQPEHVQIRHRAGEERQSHHAADRSGGGRRARQARHGRTRPSSSPTRWSSGTSRRPPTASTSCRRICRARSTTSSTW